MTDKPRDAKIKAFAFIKDVAEGLKASDKKFFGSKTDINAGSSSSIAQNPFTQTVEPLNLSNEDRESFDNVNVNLIRAECTDSDSELAESFLNLSIIDTEMAFNKAAFKKSLSHLIVPFTGERENLKLFLSSVEEAFEEIPAGNAEAIPSMLSFVVNKYTNAKLKQKLGEVKFESFAEFSKAVRNAESSNESLEKIQMRLNALKQNSVESVRTFANRIQEFDVDLEDAIKRGNFDATVIPSLVKNHLFNAFVRNLRPSLNQVCVSKGVKTIEEAITMLLSAENLIVENVARNPNDFQNSQSNMRFSRGNFRSNNFQMNKNFPLSQSSNGGSNRANFAQSSNAQNNVARNSFQNTNFNRNSNFSQNFSQNPAMNRGFQQNSVPQWQNNKPSWPNRNQQPNFNRDPNPNRGATQPQSGNNYQNQGSNNHVTWRDNQPANQQGQPPYRNDQSSWRNQSQNDKKN